MTRFASLMLALTARAWLLISGLGFCWLAFEPRRPRTRPRGAHPSPWPTAPYG